MHHLKNKTELKSVRSYYYELQTNKRNKGKRKQVKVNSKDHTSVNNIQKIQTIRSYN